jgi:hypothetical protein
MTGTIAINMGILLQTDIEVMRISSSNVLNIGATYDRPMLSQQMLILFHSNNAKLIRNLPVASNRVLLIVEIVMRVLLTHLAICSGR